MSRPAASTDWGPLRDILALPQDQRIARVRAHADPEEALLSLGEQAERLVISDLSAALEATGAVVALCDRIGPALPRARARRARAQALAYANRFEEAIGALDQAVSLAEAAGAALEAARGRLTSMHALGRLGRFDEALSAGDRARSDFMSHGEPALAAKADLNLGVVHRMRDDPRRAIEHFDRAAPLLAAEPLILAQLQSNRAEALLELNDFDAAHAGFLLALRAFESAGIARGAGIVLGNLAELHTRAGRFDLALESFELARRRLGESAAPGDAARLDVERADTMSTLGLHDRAAEVYAAAIPILEGRGMAWELARARVGLGIALGRLGRCEAGGEASEQLAAGAAGFDVLGHGAGAARARLALAELAHRRGDQGEARRLAESALEALRDRPVDAVAARLLLGRVALRAGADPAEADAHISAGLKVSERLDVPPLTAELLALRADASRRRGRVRRAARDLLRAVEQVERIRGSLQAERLRAGFLGDRAAIYGSCISALLDTGGSQSTAEAFAVLQRARGRSLLDLLQGGVGLASAQIGRAECADDAAEAEMLAELARRRAELNALFREMHDNQHGHADGWPARLRAAEQGIQAIEDRLAATRRFAGVFASPAALDRLQASLGAADALVEFFGEAGRLSAMVIRRDAVFVERAFAGLHEAAEHADRFAFQLSRAIARGLPGGAPGARLAADAVRELRTLHDLTLAPIWEHIREAARLVLVPHGPLHRIPMHALAGERGHMLDSFTMTTAPSASVFLELLERRAAAPAEGLVVVGLADALAPRAEEEARAIAGAIGADRLLAGEHATLAAFRSAVGRARLAHIATHARFMPDQPLTSGVRLADGWLTVRDAYTLDLPGTVVTLSGCDTGRSAVGAGDEVFGLVRGFLASGASAVLTSLWPLHDECAAGQMAAMYKLWYRGDSKGGAPRLADALRESQLRMRERAPHPAAWAGLQLVGAP